MSRRMFSDEITTSDAFLDMPTDSQLLYFQLGMNADDDGFIGNTKMVQRIIRAGDDSLKILFVKKFLIAFENGVCVVKHWRINNYIRKDIYKETKYIKQKKTLYIRENGAYSLNKEEALALPMGHFTLKNTFESEEKTATCTSRARNGYVGKERIGKDRKVKKKGEQIKLPDWMDKEVWESWEQYRKEIRKKLTPTTIQRQFKMLEKNKDEHIEIIEKSIQNGWTGLFEIQGKKKNKLPSASGKYANVGEKV